jgi:hypothetical protein
MRHSLTREVVGFFRYATRRVFRVCLTALMVVGLLHILHHWNSSEAPQASVGVVHHTLA